MYMRYTERTVTFFIHGKQVTPKMFYNFIRDKPLRRGEGVAFNQTRYDRYIHYWAGFTNVATIQITVI